VRVPLASGRGGAGKTTVAVSLALGLVGEEPIQSLDCDVEEPNAHLFLDSRLKESRSVDKLLPEIDEERWTRCGRRAAACELGAPAVVEEGVLRYDALCHGCGRCRWVSPADAITRKPHQLEVIERGNAQGFPFAQGRLNVGEAMATPTIHALKAEIREDRLGDPRCATRHRLPDHRRHARGQRGAARH